MQAPFCVVDAFTSKRYGGNPAAVVALPDWDGQSEWPPEFWMQAVAAEFNLSETAFAKIAAGGIPTRFDLRWFTPVREVPLCGHATLATAHGICSHFRRSTSGDHSKLEFDTASGLLPAEKDVSGCWWLDFPVSVCAQDQAPAELAEAVRAQPESWLRTDQDDWIAVYADASEVAALAPSLALLREIEMRGLIATAPGNRKLGADFVSRFFAPAYGIDEDPVTGSAHCSLTPYWAKRLNQSRLTARQISRRGGELVVEGRGAPGLIGRHCVITSSGELH